MSHTIDVLEPLTQEQMQSSDCGLSRAERAEQTADLLWAAHDSPDPAEHDALLDRVVLINRGVAEAIARRYRDRGLPQDDLVQVAFEGLTKAVARFDPDLRNDLLTYAVPTIRGEIQRHFRDHGWTVRPPRFVQETQGRAHAAARDLEQRLGREPSDGEVAEEIGVSTAEYAEALAAQGCFHPTSLDLRVGSESSTLGDLLPDGDEGQDASEARLMLEPVLRRLSERDQRIVFLRFFEDLTQAEIGADLGVTQMQVSRLLARILGDLRGHLDGDAG